MAESEVYPPSGGSYFENTNPFLDSIVRGEDHRRTFCFAADHDLSSCYPLAAAATEETSRSFFPATPYLDETAIHDRYNIDFQGHLEGMDDITAEYLKDDPILNGEISTDVSASDFEETKYLIRRSGNFGHHQEAGDEAGAAELSRNQSIISSDTSGLVDVTSTPPASTSLVLPAEGMEIDNEVSVLHLLMAYAEAMEMGGQEELREVVVKRIREKVSPVGDSSVERLMYYMFHTGGQLDKHQSSADYLKQESIKNFYPAFKAIYQIFPNGKFAHFAANLAILEAWPPNDAGIIRIFDFDIGEGIQWASLIEAISNGQQQPEVTLTSLKFSQQQQGGEYNSPSFIWRFEDTKKRLCDYARSFGLKLKMEEMELSDLMGKLKKGGSHHDDHARKEWFVFNCMVGLPHMGRVRSRKDISDFLRAASNFLQPAEIGPNNSDRGIIILGDGDSWEKLRNAPTYASFLDANMGHYQALLESIKLNFPVHLGEARTAMECLFVAPLVSSLAWAKRWEEMKEYGHDQLDFQFGLEGWRVSPESLMEAKEVVREGESLYGLRIEGERSNQMVMDWRGIPLVRVSCWRR